MDNLNCSICIEKFNLINHSRIKCEYCDFIACRTCYETYLVSQSTPHCMQSLEQCGKTWSRKFMATNFTINFIKNEYKKHQEQILFERELALMPETQIVVERQNYKENKMNQYAKEIFEINQQINELAIKRANIEQLRNNLFNNHDEDNEDGGIINGKETKTDGKQNKKMTQKCSNENCRGFLSSNWKCNLCNTWTCSECRINIKSDEEKNNHACNNDDLQTAQLIKKDSKSCPKCGINIFKISGCDQMYCTQCHTPFSWNTGRIESGVIHNPHYYEYLRNMGQNIPRNPLDIIHRCDRTLNNDFVLTMRHLLCYLSKSNVLNYTSVTIIEMCGFINHLTYVELNHIQSDINFNDNKRQYHRILYLRNTISEKEFKRIIQINEKNYQKCIELNNLHTMVRDTVIDIIYILADKLMEINNKVRIVNKKNLKLIEKELEKHNINEDQILLEFENLRTYANDCLTNISRTYHCVHKQFNPTFELVKIK